MITFLQGMRTRQTALEDVWMVCVPLEGCPEITLQLAIIEGERTAIIDRLRSRGINVSEV
jgi:hypothetical protein